MTTTCSGRNVEFVTGELGADVAIDYTQVRQPVGGGKSVAGCAWCRPAQLFPAATSPPKANHPCPSLQPGHPPQGPWEASPGATAAPFDHILDTIGGSYERASLRLLAKGGSFANLGASGPGVERVSVWGIAAMLLNALWRWAAGAVRLGPRYKL